MAKIGIFGGTFDPIHQGHLILAERCLEDGHLDKVLFLPAFQSPLKDRRPNCSDQQRVDMIKLAISGNRRFEISMIEIEQTEKSYTIETLRRFHDENPAEEICFIMGSDSLASFTRWKQPHKICEIAELMIVDRPLAKTIDWEPLSKMFGKDLIMKIQKNFVKSPLIEISSTDIRTRVSENQSIRYLLPRAVEKYIEAGNLYAVS